MVDPGATFIKSLILVILLSTAVYILPILVGVCVTPWAAWVDGSFVDVARAIGGDPMAVWVTVAGAISARPCKSEHAPEGAGQGRPQDQKDSKKAKQMKLR